MGVFSYRKQSLNEKDKNKGNKSLQDTLKRGILFRVKPIRNPEPVDYCFEGFE